MRTRRACEVTPARAGIEGGLLRDPRPAPTAPAQIPRRESAPSGHTVGDCRFAARSTWQLVHCDSRADRGRPPFLADAIAKGAVALLVESPDPGLSVPQVVVPDTRSASAILADVFYGHPSQHLSVIGVTGTNGKTTTTHLIERVLQANGWEVGLLGTIGKRIRGVTADVANTTPEAVDLQATLADMLDARCDFAVMEVSSHALELGRVAGTRYHIAVFTNITQDHLDFHGTMENYLAAKAKLFSRLGNTYGDTRRESSFAVINADDSAAPTLLAQTVAQTLTYGIDAPADVRASALQITATGARFHVSALNQSADVSMRLTGRFNVYNALAAIAVGLIEGMTLPNIAAALAEVPGIPGRFEPVDAGQPFAVLVDYSHTPDSLDNALATVREFATGRIVTVVGCGGDRDRTKRPLMAQVAARRSDWTILTSDNPRSEDPERILDDMEDGVTRFGGHYERIADRASRNPSGNRDG